MRTLSLRVAALVVLAVSAPATARADAEGPPPPSIVTVQLASGPLTLHPFTTHAFPASGSVSDDPVNLVFEGASDPREVRAALFSVDGNRSAYGIPFAFPFDCTWTDALGDEQATWTPDEGWAAGAVQLACGPYAMRFHLRLFRHGERTLGAVHMDLQIPATTEHEVLAWNFPRQLVMVDLLRSGLLRAAPYETAVFGPTPSHRELLSFIHNALPVALRSVLGLPLGNQTADVPIPSRGTALVFDLGASFAPGWGDTRTELEVYFNQGIPKPFCNAGADYVWVRGPVHFSLRVQTEPSGRFARTQIITGTLDVTPIDPRTGVPIGPTVTAQVSETHRAWLTDEHGQVRWSLGRVIYGDVTQTLFRDFNAGQQDRFAEREDCGRPAGS
jgi:hypothetical protein